jgi:hypothetical protein
LQVAQVLVKDRGANAAQLPVNSMTGRIVNKLLRTLDLDAPDLTFELRELAKSNPRLSDQIASAVGQTAATAGRLSWGAGSRPLVGVPLRSLKISETLTPPPSTAPAQDWFEANKPSLNEQVIGAADQLRALHR